MRIVCDNCGAKYQISDDKVRNKVFKIRCKKCSHTIVVRSKGDGPAASGESNEDATRVAPAPADAGGSVEAAPDAIWYVVVNREQVGPMTPAEVERRYKAGEIDADAFTWAEGMTDWIRLAAVTEFAHMFPEKAPARAPAPVRAAAPAAVAVAAAPVAKGGGLFPRDEGDDDVMVSGNDSQTSSGGADRLFGGVDDDEPAPSSPRVEDGPRLRSQRNENSVLFSLDSLSSAAESPRVSNTGGTEGSGLIDISAMLGGGGGSSSSSSGNDSFGGPIGLAPSAPAPMAGAPLPSLVNRKKSNTGLIVGIVAGAVIIAGGIVAAVVLKGGDKPAEPVATNNAPAVVSVGGDAPKSAAPATQPPSAAAVASAAGSEPASAAAPVSVAVNDASGKPVAGAGARPAGGGGGPRVAAAGGRPGGGDEDTPSVAAPRPASPSPAAPATDAPKPQKKGGGDDIDDIMGALDGKGSKPAGGGKPAAAAAPADDPLLPEQLTKPQILGVVKKAASQISSCKDRDPNASGTVMVSIQIEKSGRVGKATAKSPFAGTPVGNCVESTVRTFQFPQFSGDQMTINMPFAL